MGVTKVTVSRKAKSNMAKMRVFPVKPMPRAPSARQMKAGMVDIRSLPIKLATVTMGAPHEKPYKEVTVSFQLILPRSGSAGALGRRNRNFYDGCEFIGAYLSVGWWRGSEPVPDATECGGTDARDLFADAVAAALGGPEGKAVGDAIAREFARLLGERRTKAALARIKSR